jgi:hypothetical protein
MRHIAHFGKMRNSYKSLVANVMGQTTWKSFGRRVNIIKMDLKEIGSVLDLPGLKQ